MCEINETMKLVFIFIWRDRRTSRGPWGTLFDARLLDGGLLLGDVVVASYGEHTADQGQNSFGFTYQQY